MSKDKGKKKVIEEVEPEDWCFACKEGGNLLCCDHKGCVKVYHPRCVGKKNSVLKSEGVWTCPRHSCAECSHPPLFYCLACPDSFCRLCVKPYEFSPVKLDKGICKVCFEYALLAEKNAEFNSEGDKLNFQEPGSDDFLFKDYLLIIMKQEGLVFDDLRRAHSMRDNYNSDSDCDKFADKEAVIPILDVGSDSDYASDDSLGKIKKSQKKQGPKNKKQGRKNKKQGPENKKQGPKDKINDILKANFVDTVEVSSSDESENDSGSCSESEEELIISECKSPRTLNRDKVPLEEKVENAVRKRPRTLSPDKVPLKEKVDYAAQKRPRTLSPDKVPLKEKVEYAARKSCYASIVAENIKLVYLRRSLVEVMSAQPDNFEEKVVGSFVRVRRIPGNCSGTSFQLMQVTGIKKTSNAENKGILLEVSCMPVDIPIDKLNDDDFLEEECKDLQQRMKDGLLRKPTVVELEQKAKSLHEDITKNGIQRELVQLQGKIERAHEKGRRSMLETFLDRRERLKNPTELQRLLQKVPMVTAEVIELDATAGNSSGSNCST